VIVEPLPIDASSAASMSATSTAFFALQALGISVDPASLSLSIAAKSALPADLICTPAMDVTIDCGASPDEGTVRLQGACHSIAAEHCGLIADFTLTFTGCSPIGGIVLQGTETLRLLMAAYQCDFAQADLGAEIRADDFTVQGASAAIVKAMAFTVKLAAAAIDPQVEWATIDDAGVVKNCQRDVVGGVSCGAEIVLEKASLCQTGWDCTSDDDCWGGCLDGCCVVGDQYASLEGSYRRECPEIKSPMSEIITRTFVDENGDVYPYSVPVACINGVWQVPCQSDADCRQGATCELFTDLTYSTPWLESFSATFSPATGYGLCGVFDIALTGESISQCANGLDDDSDGKIDCLDEDCFWQVPACPVLICAQGCLMPYCDTYPGCYEELCHDDIDNDGNGLADCADSHCAVWDPGCETSEGGTCFDTLDNDADGFTDCDDPGCTDFGSARSRSRAITIWTTTATR
jgi:hypothetical protein